MTSLLPNLSLDTALRELRARLEELPKLKDCCFEKAKVEEEEWMHFTENIIESSFGRPSTNLAKFHNVRQAGLTSRDPDIRFKCRIEEYEALLRALVRALELRQPEEGTQGVYPPGAEYEFYRHLSALVRESKNRILIVDPYLSEEVFDLYVHKVPDGRNVFILSNNLDTNVNTVAQKYARSRPLELRSSSRIHDRVVFIDSRAWVIGQSIKDAARQKPTYLVELPAPLVTVATEAYAAIWERATVSVSSPADLDGICPLSSSIPIDGEL